jgi:uncharacterized protein involved in propanediol utilization
LTSSAGTGRAGAHHGEILQGVFAGRETLVRGLVTLPYSRYEAEAAIVLVSRDSMIEVEPSWKFKAGRAARLALDAVGLREVSGRLALRGGAPVARGFGSSTSDVVATIRAVCSASGSQLDEHEIATLAVRSEAASDPLMFDRAVLFAQREGVVLEDFGACLPPLHVLGFSTTADGAGVPTLAFPPASYSADEAEDFEQLRLRLRNAVAHGDAIAVGAVATASTRLNQRYLPVENLDRLTRIVDRVGAAGMQVSHSGDIAGLLFDPSAADVELQVGEAERLLAEAGIAETWRFRAP